MALDQDLSARPSTAAVVDEGLVQEVVGAAYPLYVEYRKTWRKLHDVLHVVRHREGLLLAARPRR